MFPSIIIMMADTYSDYFDNTIDKMPVLLLTINVFIDNNS